MTAARPAARPDDPLPRTGFDYAALPAAVAAAVREQAESIHRLLARTSGDVVQVGLRLRFARERLGRSGFQPWLKAEFCWSQPTASNYMRAAEAFGQLDCVGRFQPSALFLLARKRVPAAARAEAVRLAGTGARVTKSAAAGLVACHAPASAPGDAVDRLVRDVGRAVAGLPDGELKALAVRLLAAAEGAAAERKSLRTCRRRG